MAAIGDREDGPFFRGGVCKTGTTIRLDQSRQFKTDTVSVATQVIF
jgi:hypothetical protein